MSTHCKKHGIPKGRGIPCWICEPSVYDRKPREKTDLWFFLRAQENIPKGINLFKVGMDVIIEFKGANRKVVRLSTGLRTVKAITYREWAQLFRDRYAETSV